jgi:hypothetical protein
MRSLQSHEIVNVENMPPGHRVKKSVTSRGHNLVSIFDIRDLIALLHLLVPALHELILRLETGAQFMKRPPALSDIGFSSCNVNVTDFCNDTHSVEPSSHLLGLATMRKPTCSDISNGAEIAQHAISLPLIPPLVRSVLSQGNCVDLHQTVFGQTCHLDGCACWGMRTKDLPVYIIHSLEVAHVFQEYSAAHDLVHA